MDTPENRRRAFWIGSGLAAFSALFLFLTRSAEQYGDSLSYLASVKTGTGLFHPHHILYNPAVLAVWRFLSAIGVKATPLDAAQIHNILWAAAAVTAVFLIVRRRLRSEGLGVLAALGLLASQGFWEYSTQAQIYVPALGVLALILLVLLKSDRAGLAGREVLLLGGLYALAVLYHQSNVLFIFPLAAFAWARFGRAGLRKSLAAAVGGGAVAGAAYIGAFLTTGASRTLSGFLRYALHYVYHPDPLWGTLRSVSPKGLGYLLFSQLRAFIPVVDPFQRAAVAAFALGLLALLAWSVRSLVRRGKSGEAWRILLLVWLAVHFTFFLWWSPTEKNMYIISLLPLVLLAAWAGGDLEESMAHSPRRKTAAAVLAAGALLVMAGANYAALIRPLRLSKGADYVEADRLQSCVPPGEVILTNNDVREELSYYFERPDVLLVEIPPMSICQDLPVPAEYDLLRVRPAVLSASYIYPQSRLAVISGYDKPRGWKRFLEWLFGLEFDSAGRASSCRSFEALSCRPGYLRLGLARISLDGWPDFLGRLDAFVQSRLGAEPGTFRRWAISAGL